MRRVVEQCTPALDDQLPLAHVPDHDEEDQRHQRNLGELGLTLRAHLDGPHREDEDRHDDRSNGASTLLSAFHIRRP